MKRNLPAFLGLAALVGAVVLAVQAAQQIAAAGGQVTAGAVMQGTANNAAILGGKILETITGQSRGIRNNNPGNIRHGASWQGMAAQQTDANFIQFISPEYGIRALNKVLDTYANSYGLNTVRGIISRWAPASENNTAAYISSVAASMGVSADQILGAADRPALVQAIITHENGQQPYTLATIDSGLSMA